MPLQIGGSGTVKPFCKYNAKSDKWFVRGVGGEEVEISRPTFVIDLDNIATGWFRFREGQAPERVIDPSLNQPAPSPGEEFKRGFAVMVFSPKSLRRGRRVWQRIDPSLERDQGHLRAVRGREGRSSRRAASHCLHRLRGDEGPLRNELPSGVQDCPVGRATKGPAKPEPGRRRGYLERRHSQRTRRGQGTRPARSAAGARTQACSCLGRSAQRSAVLTTTPEGFGPPVLSPAITQTSQQACPTSQKPRWSPTRR